MLLWFRLELVLPTSQPARNEHSTLCAATGNSLATGPSCSQEHLRNTAQRTASSPAMLLQVQTQEMKTSAWLPFLFTFGTPEKRYLSRDRQPLLRMATRAVARDSRAAAWGDDRPVMAP